MRSFVLFTALTLASSGGALTLLPLDSRPAARTLPALIAGLAGPVAVPPAGMLGDRERGADPDALLAWLRAHPGPAVVSLDALAYGGLVQSRQAGLSTAEALARLAPLRELQGPLHAFVVIPRHPDATPEVRARNLNVIRELLRCFEQGAFAALHVTWDDALPGSPAPTEAAALARVAPEGVRVYPGADEVAAVLAARALRPGVLPLRVVYARPERSGERALYDGLPLAESVARHAAAAGYALREDAGRVLYVYNGGDPRRAALEISAWLRRGPVALADVARVNTGTPALYRDLHTLRRVSDLDAFAAWGTPANNIGTALAWARLAGGADPLRQDALRAHAWANDLLYSNVLRPALRAAIPEAELNDPARVGETLGRLAGPLFPFRIGLSYGLGGARLPWNRSFEWEFWLRSLP